MSNMITRAITGTFYVLSVIAAIFIHPIVCMTYFFIVAMIGLNEFYINSRKATIRPNILFGNILGVLLYAMIILCSSCEENLSSLFYSILIVICLATFISELYHKEKQPFTNIAYTFLGVIYVVVPLALTSLIVNIKGDFSPMILMAIFIFAWCNDTFAYLVGRKFGKHKLFERISPKKTWEGSIGGFVSVIIAAIIIALCDNSIEVYDYIIIAILTSIVGTFGDLTESMFKRQIGVKDSGKILPGHGGILDRFDILLLSLPIVYAYLRLRFGIF
ncbi:MAG: phosphatidate cytidylyltransferase [Bacteroidota bacterium]|nr:phosphatidate cytidylyltransferase [Bacteroidota bacterium]